MHQNRPKKYIHVWHIIGGQTHVKQDQGKHKKVYQRGNGNTNSFHLYLHNDVGLEN